MRSCRWHAHTNKQPSHTHASKQQRPFLFPSYKTNHAWVGAADVSPFVPLHFRQLSRGVRHKRNQMYFLLAEVRQACRQTAISLRMSGRAAIIHRGLMDGVWSPEPRTLTAVLIRRMLLRDKLEHSSIINRLTATLRHYQPHGHPGQGWIAKQIAFTFWHWTTAPILT